MNSSFFNLLLSAICLSTGTAWGQTSFPKVIAHRGASKEAPENTLIAFAKAISIGVDAIEMDIHLTSDGVPIVVHDGIFGRTTEGAYLKKTVDLTFEEVQSLDAGTWFGDAFNEERIPALDEVLQLSQSNVRLMVEIKNDNSSPKDLAQAVLSSLQNINIPVVIGSFDPLIIEEIQLNGPEFPVIGIVEDRQMLEKFRRMPVKHMAIWYPLLSAGLIQQLHEEGIEVWTFTVDNPGLAKYLASLGIDGIITNDPRKIKQTFSRPGSAALVNPQQKQNISLVDFNKVLNKMP